MIMMASVGYGDYLIQKTLLTFCEIIIFLAFSFLSPFPTSALEQPTGEEIIREAVLRHETYSSLCEDLTMVLTGPQGERSVRELKSFLRQTPEGGAHYLLVIDAPTELSGVSLLVRRLPSGKTESSLYLPAFGKEMKGKTEGGGSLFLDTDFTPLDFIGEKLADFNYLRGEDARTDLVDYWVIEALPRLDEIARKTGYGKRKIFVRRDNFFIARIDYIDRHGRLIKRQTRHDLKRIEGETWQSNMVLMEGLVSPHQTLLKRNRKVFAEDCAPEDIFTPERIFSNPHRAEGKGPEEEAGDTQKEAEGTP